ncbi:hypothetical protein Ddye_028668 [Dipteronia dyeriana]|uniref:SWIM-type domain-containing protein n=1 Tax=Dipteronia dyeriana TaxID=168575 RepID=A0AAD9TDT5_9ROSI|nr:hypothetical protein Ddye_028668 [Dipteronia dyeriana]
MFRDKKTLKGALEMNALAHRFDYKAWKLRNETYWNVTSVDSKYTYGDNRNYNVDFHHVSAQIIGQLFSKKFIDLGCHIRPKDLMTDMRDNHCIKLSYDKAYRSKDCTFHNVFSDPSESFKMLPTYFHMLEKCNPGTKTKIETDRKNRFKYGFMALGACIEGSNTIIRQVIVVDAIHLKSKTRGVLLVAVCKVGNEMIYPLAFGFANYKCSKSWTWFLKQLRKVILQPELMLIISDRHTGISIGMKTIFPNATHRFKVEDQWNEAIVDMEHRLCSCREWDLDELPCIHAMVVAMLKGMSINVLCFDFFMIGWLKQAYAMAVNPVLNSEAWDIADDVRNHVVLPCSYEGPVESCYSGVVIVSYVESIIRVKRANVGRLTVENEILARKFDNLEVEIINLHFRMEARDNELNGLYTVVEKLQKKLLDFDIPPSP